MGFRGAVAISSYGLLCPGLSASSGGLRVLAKVMGQRVPIPILSFCHEGEGSPLPMGFVQCAPDCSSALWEMNQQPQINPIKSH